MSTTGPARLLLLTPDELTRDPRARRAAVAGRRAGINVAGLCLGGSAPASLDGVHVIRVLPDALTARRSGSGEPRSEGTLVREARGLFRLVRLLRTTIRLAHAGRDLRPTIVHANDFDTLPAATLIARRSQARLVYDAHELYSGFETRPPMIWAAVQRQVEGRLARRADAVVTVSRPIATRLGELYHLRAPALVALNCPATTPELDGSPIPADEPLRVIYQAAAGPNRVLSDLLEAARSSSAAHITLRIAGSETATLERKVAASGVGSVAIAEPVPPDRLVEALAAFHVGLVIDRRATPNTELALPNKLFEYLMAGLAVVVPGLAAMAELVEREQIGLTFEPGDPRDLARALDELAADRPRLEAMRHRARELALTRYNAEAQEHVLLEAWGL